jgi:tetratricopeptide (TPR) repeat protein
LYLGEILYRQGHLDEAIAVYRDGIENSQRANTFLVVGAAIGADVRVIRGFQSRPSPLQEKTMDRVLVAVYGGLGAMLDKKGGPWAGEAIVFYQKAIDLASKLDPPPSLALLHNCLAWLLATTADKKLCDPVRAVASARKAVELTPNDGHYWNTLGVAHYRNSEWKEAVAALEKSKMLPEGGESADFFFLAMAHWQLGDKEKARSWYDMGVQRMEKNPSKEADHKRFRAEAAEVLGIEAPRPKAKD